MKGVSPSHTHDFFPNTQLHIDLMEKKNIGGVEEQEQHHKASQGKK